MAHTLLPHEGAVPLMLTGKPLGNPLLAGIGAHIQRYFLGENADPKAPPYSYVIESSSPQLAGATSAAVAIGSHPGAARPLSFKIDAAADFAALLARGTVGDHRAAYDALVQANANRFGQRLAWQGKGAPLRSQSFGDDTAAGASLANASVVQGMLPSQYFQLTPGTSCGTNAVVDPSSMSFKMAAHLLTHPVYPARYVGLMDGGITPSMDAGGYDTHSDNCPTQSRNLVNTMRGLASIINDASKGEKDPTKLDLDKTLIVVTTEFGRTPDIEGNKGRGHWPAAFPVLMFGGPVRQAAVSGTMHPDFTGSGTVAPSELRIAMLLALGIWPFAPESFNVSDVPGAASEVAGAGMVKNLVLGVKS
jgi:hypothetical protein